MSSTNKLSSRNITWCQANDITCVKAGRSNRQPKTFHIYGFAGVLAMPNGITRYSRCQRVRKGIFHADLTIVWWYRRYPSRRPSWVKIFASTSLTSHQSKVTKVYEVAPSQARYARSPHPRAWGGKKIASPKKDLDVPYIGPLGKSKSPNTPQTFTSPYRT